MLRASNICKGHPWKSLGIKLILHSPISLRILRIETKCWFFFSRQIGIKYRRIILFVYLFHFVRRQHIFVGCSRKEENQVQKFGRFSQPASNPEHGKPLRPPTGLDDQLTFGPHDDGCYLDQLTVVPPRGGCSNRLTAGFCLNRLTVVPRGGCSKRLTAGFCLDQLTACPHGGCCSEVTAGQCPAGSRGGWYLNQLTAGQHGGWYSDQLIPGPRFGCCLDDGLPYGGYYLGQTTADLHGCSCCCLTEPNPTDGEYIQHPVQKSQFWRWFGRAASRAHSSDKPVSSGCWCGAAASAPPSCWAEWWRSQIAGILRRSERDQLADDDGSTSLKECSSKFVMGPSVEKIKTFSWEKIVLVQWWKLTMMECESETCWKFKIKYTPANIICKQGHLVEKYGSNHESNQFVKYWNLRRWPKNIL